MFNERQKSKTWNELKQEYSFHENKRFSFTQLLHAIPKSWKDDLSDVKENIHKLIFQDHHLIRTHHMLFLNRLSSKEIYNFLIAQKEKQTSSRLYYQKKFNARSNLDCKNIYLLVRTVTKDSKLRAFQFKILNNVPYLNKMLFKFGKGGSPLCSFCNLKDETPYRLFVCNYTNFLWNQLRHFLSNSLNIPPLTPQGVIFGLINQKENFLIINHLLFILKFYTYNFRYSSKLNIEYLKTITYKTRNIELDVSKTATIRKQKYTRKATGFKSL